MLHQRQVSHPQQVQTLKKRNTFANLLQSGMQGLQHPRASRGSFQEIIHSLESAETMDGSQTALQLCDRAAPPSLILITGTSDVRRWLLWLLLTGSQFRDSLKAENVS